MAVRERRDGAGSDKKSDKKDDKHAAPPAPEPLEVAVPDSHTHLDLQDSEVADAIKEATAVGVPTLIQIGIDVPSSAWAADTAAAHQAIWATVALHPNEAPRIDDLEKALAEIDALAARPEVRGIGETGLDHFRTEGPDAWARQEESFRRHIDIAKRHGKTLVIHDRDAHADVLSVLESEGPPERVVFHCYSGDEEMARICAEHGYVMSFAGNVTYKANQHLRDALAIAPRELLMVETDAPFLTPLPFRGRPNAPYLIPLTVRAMADVRGEDPNALGAALAATTERMFGPF
ncbi:TatD family hydrolase [Sporichthya sp.]|uniref:TatD family hydrolase n=1 Tax=Sporichthya sp. TaxID=65475 RepID=UPI001831DB20|nr:TatD family hydrolase [Sporichthya sp.]MBA3745393.1 TatD family hydrolase [Sporichthya sp.]